jgi:hypothetical protein
MGDLKALQVHETGVYVPLAGTTNKARREEAKLKRLLAAAQAVVDAYVHEFDSRAATVDDPHPSAHRRSVVEARKAIGAYSLRLRGSRAG